jgi:hypothetical protein
MQSYARLQNMRRSQTDDETPDGFCLNVPHGEIPLPIPLQHRLMAILQGVEFLLHLRSPFWSPYQFRQVMAAFGFLRDFPILRVDS